MEVFWEYLEAEIWVTSDVIIPVDAELLKKQVIILVQIALIYNSGGRPQNSADFHQLKIMSLVSERR